MYLKSSERELERSILLSGIAWTVVFVAVVLPLSVDTNRHLFVLVFLWCVFGVRVRFVYYRERRMAFCYKISTWCVYDIRKGKSRWTELRKSYPRNNWEHAYVLRQWSTYQLELTKTTSFLTRHLLFHCCASCCVSFSGPTRIRKKRCPKRNPRI